jgi:DNA invertase Pin-like site-specific DNA recombinase
MYQLHATLSVQRHLQRAPRCRLREGLDPGAELLGRWTRGPATGDHGGGRAARVEPRRDLRGRRAIRKEPQPAWARASAHSREERPGERIVVAKLDRLSRSLVDFASLLADAKRQSYNVVALDLGVDLSTPAGEFLASVMASAAQWERRIIGQRTKDALAVRGAQGVRLRRPREMSSEAVERIRELRATGMTVAAIARQLEAEQLPTPRGGRWESHRVSRALRFAETA